MKRIGTQFLEKMKSRVANKTKFHNITKKVAEKMADIAETNTRRGETVKGGRYDKRYNERYARAKNKSNPVNLRDQEYSVEKMRGVNTGRKGGIRGAKRLGDHDKGIRYSGGFKRRQMFPENHSQVPKKLSKYMKKEITKLLTGYE